MKNIFLLALLFFSINAFSQTTISGTVRDVTTGEGLVSAVVIVDDGTIHALTDVDGNYKLSLANGTYVLRVKYVGYSCDSFPVTVDGKPIVHDFNCTTSSLKEVQIVADVAIDRKTPVAFSNINQNQIEEEGGNRDITMLLNSTPGAYATEQGGGAGDSRISIRGVDQRNIGVMVDGVPSNDMETGQVYWSD